MRCLPAILSMALCAAERVCAVASGSVIGGGSPDAEPASLASPESVGLPLSDFFLTLMLLGLFGAVAWKWVDKRRAKEMGDEGPGLKIAETRMLGNKQFLVIADYKGRKTLLGVGPGFVTALRDYDEPVSAPKAAPERDPDPPPKFTCAAAAIEDYPDD